MLRRHLLGLAAIAPAAFSQRKQAGGDPDAFVAGATEDATPRVAIVLSSFRGSKDHDGTALGGLRSPTPADSPLTTIQVEDMVRKAIELGNTRRGDLSALVGAADWIVIKPQIVAHRTAGGKFVRGSVADPRVVYAVMRWLAEHRAGKRITIAEGPSCSGGDFDAWSAQWDDAFGDRNYRDIVRDIAPQYPRVRFDVVDLNNDETMDMQTPARAGAADAGVYKIAATLLRCQALITVAPLATSTVTGVSLTVGSYLGALPARTYGRMREKAAALGARAEVLVDLFSFRPPDYAIVGGEWGLEGGDPQTPGAESVRHSVLLAGANGIAVDRVAAAVMGHTGIAHLDLASRRGLGVDDLDSVWMRGNEIEEATRKFRAATPQVTG